MAGDEVGVGAVLEYGIRLTGVILVLGLLTGGLVFLGTTVGGSALAEGGSGGETALSVTLFVLAGVILYGGLFGIVYKVIADAVREGIEMSSGLV